MTDEKFQEIDMLFQDYLIQSGHDRISENDATEGAIIVERSLFFVAKNTGRIQQLAGHVGCTAQELEEYVEEIDRRLDCRRNC